VYFIQFSKISEGLHCPDALKSDNKKGIHYDPASSCAQSILSGEVGTLLGMHDDEIFHFEIFKNFMEILKYFKTPSLKCFTKLFIIK